MSLTFAASTALAGTAEVTGTAPKEKSALEKLWDLPVLYKNDRNPVIEEFDFTGRFQLDYFNVESDKGDRSFTEIRRFRLGMDSWWANRHLQVKATVDTNLRTYAAPEVFYQRFTDLFMKIHVNDAVNVRVGKFEPHFGFDREFSDNLQKTFERSFYDDQLIGGGDYIAGVEVSGKVGAWGYLAAVYSTNVNKEFGDFDGGQAYQAEISYDFSKRLGCEKALWVLDYLHADGKNANTNVFANYNNAAATYFDFQKGRFSLVTQFAYGNGISIKGDTYEFMVMPAWKITPKLEVVARYQLGLSSKANGITTLNRQEKTVGNFTGDEYNAPYVGLNYYLHGQKMKIMIGEQYANLGGGTGPKAGYSGWTTLVGFRIFW